MRNKAHFQEMTFQLLKQLKSKKEALEARHAIELADIDKEIEAVSITLRLLAEVPETDVPREEIKGPSVIPNDLFGKSTREACIEIARRNNGVVFVGEAKKALIASRILKDSKNTWAIIYTTLRRSKEFEKTDVSGAFRLISPASQSQQGDLLQ
jgi:hypothetical protein